MMARMVCKTLGRLGAARELDGSEEEGSARTAWDVCTTQIGLLMVVVADPRMWGVQL
jgi:hypothetical protein